MSIHTWFPFLIGPFPDESASGGLIDKIPRIGIENQIKYIKEKKGEGDLEKVLFGGNTWEVE